MKVYVLKLSLESDVLNFSAAHQEAIQIQVGNRAAGQLEKVKNGDAVVVVGHGNGDEVGSSHSEGHNINASAIWQLFRAIGHEKDHITVFFAVCDSDEIAATLQSHRPNWTVTGFEGSPRLHWPSGQALPVRKS